MRFNVGIQYWNEGYKELAVPSTDRGWAVEKNVIHIWPRGNYMLIAFPNTDQSFTCSLHLPFEGSPSFESIITPGHLTRLFKESFPDAVDFIPGLIDSFFENPTNPMITVKCSPWSYKDKVTILGDAAHSIYPSYGQGANAGFEDCTVLDECIRERPNDRATMLRAFEDRRRPNTDAIAELCVHHFTELHDLVGTPRFLLRKRIERKLNQLYPSDYKDLYSMISFTCLPYIEALQIDRKQRAIVDRLMQVAGSENDLDSPEMEHMMAELMAVASTRQQSAAD
jgi:kynurenine 3-monooxygenase